jgi:lipopolysaccharide export system permease protein
VSRIDRYVLVLFIRTLCVCFCSIGGIFIVFHAFNSLDELVAQGQREGSLFKVALHYYLPYMLLLFDWTGAIIALLALLFTVGWLRRTGELTATLSVGISHGRILRPLIFAALGVVLLQTATREWLLPRYRDSLSMKAKDIGGEGEQSVLPSYDRTSGILFEGRSIVAKRALIRNPSFHLYGDFPGFGDLLVAESAVWEVADANHASGYRLSGVRSPENIDLIDSRGTNERLILQTSRDQPWLQRGECFVATTVDPDMLQSNPSNTRMAPLNELVARVRNPAVHSAASVHVLLHERILRTPLDFALILLGLPLVVNRFQKNLFILIAVAMFTVLGFFLLKTVASALGGSGYLLSPSDAAWLPLVIIGPIAYARLRDIETV